MNPKNACLKRREEDKTSPGGPNLSLNSALGIDPSRLAGLVKFRTLI